MVAKDLGPWRAWRDRLDSWLFPGSLRAEVLGFMADGLGKVDGNWVLWLKLKHASAPGILGEWKGRGKLGCYGYLQ